MNAGFSRPLIAFVIAVLLCHGLAAQEHAADLTSVIVTLRPPPRGEAAFDPASVGGVLEHRSAFRMVIRVPADAIDDIRNHAGVRSVQRAGTGFPDRRAAKVTGNFEAGTQGTGVWSTGPYAYDGRGSVTTVGPSSDAKTDQYLYDSLDRIKSSTIHAGATPYAQSFQYDQYGNLIARTTGATTVSTPAETATNRLAASLGAQYDASGNMTRDLLSRLYEYDAAGMPSARTGDSAYLYTSDDERLAVIDLGENTWRWTIRDLSQKVVREYESTATGTAQQSFLWLEDHYYANGRVIAADLDPAEGTRRHFHLDHLGSTRMVTNGAGERISSHAYYPFGAEATSLMQERARGYEREEPLRFTGHERDGLEDATGQHALYLDYMHARYYSPHWGRFLTPDPTDDSFDATRPQSWNRYAYVENNPANQVDADGKVITLPAAAAGAVIGALVGGGIEAASQYMTTGKVDYRKIGAAAAAGAVTGAVAGLTGGGSLVAGVALKAGQKVAITAATAVVAGMGERSIDGDDNTKPLSTSGIVKDAAFGAAASRGGQKLGEHLASKAANSKAHKLAVRYGDHVVRAAKNRSPSRRAAAEAIKKAAEEAPKRAKATAEEWTATVADVLKKATDTIIK